MKYDKPNAINLVEGGVYLVVLIGHNEKYVVVEWDGYMHFQNNDGWCFDLTEVEKLIRLE